MFFKKKSTIVNEYKKTKKQILKKFLKHFILYSFIIIIIYLIILFLILFIFFPKFFDNKNENTLHQISNLSDLNTYSNLNTYLNLDSKRPNQQINVIIITNIEPKEIFNKINWEENEIFNKDKITLKTYYRLYKNKTLPVSKNYFNSVEQDLAFQEITKSNLKREHIRLWKSGTIENTNQSIYLGSISYDNGIDVTFYHDFIVPLHQFDPNIDKSRNHLLNKFLTIYPPTNYYLLNTGLSINQSKKNKLLYYTDGNILVLEFNN